MCRTDRSSLRWSLTLLVLILLTACSSSPSKKLNLKPQLPQTNQQLFQLPDEQVPSLSQLTSLTPIQVQEIEVFVSQPDIRKLPKNKQVFEYLSKKLVNFNYEGVNYTASEAMDNAGGNCMSLALLTFAVAKQLGVKSAFQVMHTEPMLLEVTENIAVTSDHVRTYLYEESNEVQSATTLFFNRDYVILDYFPGRYDRTGKVINEQQFFAMFYRNLAADSLLAGNFDLAYQLLEKGLSYDELYAPLINMMAIIHRRKGDEDTAERIYQYGLDVTDSKISLLSNYYFLLSKQGNTLAAEEIKKQLLQLEDSNPYDWYLIGKSAMKNGDFKSAEVYFNKFLNNTPYYHQAYFDLAKAQYAMGREVLAKSSIKLALEYAELPQSQKQYLAKLNWLEQM
ncbi:lipopolysaccharide assembly protein LapB [Shewanella sp. UCD-KL12]|uniref:tetratricopeptide repeat protein n=1 Tax=Shewanella sp. UCD-KL12 TaxID=1917163 RepID=UPI00097092AD|nr:hypothetical protein [Shewanella sp. UCD-KL12]